MSSRDRLAALESRQEIADLPGKYALAVDTRDPGLMMSLFLDTGDRYEPPTLGHHEMREYADALWGDLQESILFVTNHLVQLKEDEPDQATGTVYCLCRFGDDGRWNEQAIRYDDVYARTDEGWKFATRTHLLWYGQVLPTNPMVQPPADWPASQIGRGVLPDAWPSWRAATGRTEATSRLRGRDGRPVRPHKQA